MLRSLFVAVGLGLLLAVPAARADDEDYVKVEIKGQFYVDGLRPGKQVNPMVKAGKKAYDLDLTKMVAGAPTEKQLKAMDGEVVVVEGHLVLKSDARPRVIVTKIALDKKDPKQ